ncbi:SusC/RagA family TonB-linked outer membrane protein [Flavobacterium sp. UBA7682]|uniref:SusC/RagA family TonB-linked outer membrane protein n=1 Tax=Flavobacterium sp. UBA7682 TaxID=1946560 RepID=UPI0025BF829B|nr:SusC/RagA family TonB-linked outer membrane protein [Flavobacterium sp. UBA7682]
MKTIYKKLLFLFLLLPFGALAQSSLSGVVLDSKSNQPLPGVNVIVQGANSSTTTDFDGKFQLGGLKNGDKVVFSFIGYDSKTVTFSGQNTVNISLEESANQLQEVVVQVGYGTVKKKDATGSVTTVGAKDFNKGSNVTAENLLNGRVAGLTVNTSGAPGSGSEIRIRGGSSLFASNDPLIVIDGLPIENNADNNRGTTSVLAALNPNDIESFTVLKDASATAIYGSRASNGVIIITTKRGGKKLAVDYNFQYGSGRLVDKISVFNGDAYRDLITDLRPGDVSMLGTANTDWQDKIYRRTDYVDNNISIKGNLFNIIPARLSFGNTYQEGLRLTNTFNRNTVSTALNPSFFNDHLKIRLNATYTNEKNRFADGVEGSALRFNPTQPVYDPASPFGGFFEYYNPDGTLQLGTRNPVAQLLQTDDRGVNNRVFGNFEIDYKFHFFPALRAVINLGFDEANGERTKLMGADAASGPSNNNLPYGKNEYEESIARNKLFDAYLVYTKTFGKIDFEAQAGYSYQIRQNQIQSTGNILDPNLPSNFPETTIFTDNVLLGYFGRTKLAINDTYLFTFTVRRDGSSRFPSNEKYGTFPSAAFAWKLKNLAFKDSKVISDLKLRLGYGITGQQEFGGFNERNFYLQQYTTGSGSSQYIFGTSPTPIAISNPYNPALKWEQTTTYNVGFDYGLFNDRITGALDLFYKVSDDLIVNAAFADGGNFSNAGFQNIGSFSTKGIEFSLDAQVIKNDNFNWNVNFNTTAFKRRIDELAYGADIFTGDTGAGTGGTAQILREGYTPYSFYVYKQLYDASGSPIEGAYADLNGDGIINGDDRYIYKNADPKVTFGFASTMNYKNFDFSFNARASYGARIYNAVNAGRAQYNSLINGVLENVPTSVLNTGFTTTADVVLSDIYVENGSFIRLDNVTLGYTFPKWIEGKASLRLFTGVQNALLITDYSGLDPEITNNGRDNTIYPRQRSFLFGANIKF